MRCKNGVGPLLKKDKEMIIKENTPTPVPHRQPAIGILVADDKKAHLYKKQGAGIETLSELIPIHPSRGDEAFAREVTEWLDGFLHRKSFERLVLAAPPKLLGLLRKHTGKRLQLSILAEIDKELSHMNMDELQNELDKILWP